MTKQERAYKLSDDIANSKEYSTDVSLILDYADEIRREQRNLFRDVLQTCLDSMRERAKVVASLGGIATRKWDDEERMMEAAITGNEVLE